mgnify:CR=1 FL=1
MILQREAGRDFQAACGHTFWQSFHEQVNVAVVQCRDARDMGGHYPPICYPGQGWTPKNPGIAVPLRLGGGPVTVVGEDGFDAVKSPTVNAFRSR